ncbi:hypothetical protein L484_015529 [Morus notabilis]|uniref:Uncharacterized protein n=1 Tax=Morus notabilis TaxID=981085 RepID=W9RJF3_9ROSA|nr:hypothetical protein L484_015529 [Morus notabilis]
MAGLQYNFFPTDFLYPRPPSADTTPKSVVSVQNRRSDVADEVVLDERHQQRQQQSKAASSRTNDVVASIATAPSPLLRRNQRGSANSLSSLFPEQSSD